MGVGKLEKTIEKKTEIERSELGHCLSHCYQFFLIQPVILVNAEEKEASMKT